MELTLNYSSSVTDYGPVIQGMFQQLLDSADVENTLYIEYGVYPMLSVCTITENNKTKILNLIGKPNNELKYPVFVDTDSTKAPHSFFVFVCDIGKLNMKATVKNIETIGNNVTWTPNHPHIAKQSRAYTYGVYFLNLKEFHVDNMTVRNLYGSGIMAGNFLDNTQKLYRNENSTVRNCKVYNSWAWNPNIDDAGDGISFYGNHYNWIVENNYAVNDVNVTRYIGRCGIVSDHHGEKCTFRNNIVGGYDRTFHLECSYGGNIIEGNTSYYTNLGLTLSDDCGWTEDNAAMFSPNIFNNNTYYYNQEFEIYRYIPRKERSLIGVFFPSFTLYGTQITNNKYFYGIDMDDAWIYTKEKIDRIYYDFKGQQNLIVSGNEFTLVDIANHSTTPVISQTGTKITINAPGRIFYTLDGTEPTTLSPVYSEGLTVSRNALLRVKAKEENKSLSVEASKLIQVGVEPFVGESKYLFNSVTTTLITNTTKKYHGMKVTVGRTPIVLHQIGRKTGGSGNHEILMYQYDNNLLLFEGNVTSGGTGYNYATVPNIRLEAGKTYLFLSSESNSFESFDFVNPPLNDEIRIASKYVLNQDRERYINQPSDAGQLLKLKYSVLYSEKSNNLALGVKAIFGNYFVEDTLREVNNKDFIENAVDGDVRTRAVPNAFNWNLKIDFGKPETFNEIKVVFDKDFYSTYFQMYVSDNGTDWINIFPSRGNGKLERNFSFPTQHKRYIRFRSDNPFDFGQLGDRMGFRSFEVYNT